VAFVPILPIPILGAAQRLRHNTGIGAIAMISVRYRTDATARLDYGHPSM
jgi:hypothetical protein